MRKEDERQGKPGEMMAAMLIGVVVAIATQFLVLLLGAVCMAKGLVREDIQLQLVALACVIGGLVGGLVCACRWPARKLLAGMGTGLVCILVLCVISLVRGGGRVWELSGLVVSAATLCGGAFAGLLCLKLGTKKRISSRRVR